MIRIELTQGQFAFIDKSDAHLVLPYTWFAEKRSKGRFYAARNVHTPRGKRLLRMHRAIIACPEGMDIDHINRNGMDNRRSNLRICTRSQNLMNKIKDDTYDGVFFDKSRNRWRAIVQANKIRYYAGQYKTKEAALVAREKLAKELHGIFYRGGIKNG